MIHFLKLKSLSCWCSVAESCPTLWPHGLQQARFPALHQLPELTQIHVHWVSDAIQPCNPLSSATEYPGIYKKELRNCVQGWLALYCHFQSSRMVTARADHGAHLSPNYTGLHSHSWLTNWWRRVFVWFNPSRKPWTALPGARHPETAGSHCSTNGLWVMLDKLWKLSKPQVPNL